MAKTKKVKTNVEKEKKTEKIGFRLTPTQLEIIDARADACNIDRSKYLLLSALDRKRGAKAEQLLVYNVISLAQDIANHVQEYYCTGQDDDRLNEMMEDLWKKLL